MNAHKRQRIPTRRCERLEESPRETEKSSSAGRNCRGYALDTLPPEVLEMILRLLPFHDVATSMRLVSRHCATVAVTVLNGAFLAAGSRLENLLVRIDRAMKDAKTDAELITCRKAINALELIKAQYQMLRAVTWRYTHPLRRRQKFPRLCFYAGSLLDDLNNLLTSVATNHPSVVGPRASNSRITCFVAVCKRFMNFFEKVSERTVNRSALISGCKVVDVLDCLIEGRQVISFMIVPDGKIASGLVSMKLKYTMERAWFTCLAISKNSEKNSWRDEQRFMYLRLRRLVGSVNEHLFENLSRLLLQVPLTLPLSPLPASTYSGYGEFDGQFFYYGNMNKYAYENKFTNIVNQSSELETEQQVTKPPSFDLVIEIELQCTPELAPLAVKRYLKSDEFEACETKSHRYQQLFLKMNITCPASKANRLPGNFVWELRSPRRVRKSAKRAQ